MPTSSPASALGNLTDLALPHPPQRVVPLAPSITSSLCDLGLGGRVAAVTDYSLYRAPALSGLPRVGEAMNPSIAGIVALAPDLVIANWEENREADVAALREAGLPVWVTFPCTCREALNLLWALIRLFDAPQAGHLLAALERSFEITSQAASATPSTPVFSPIWREPPTGAGPVDWWMTGNQSTYLHDVLRVCGGENVFGSREERFHLAADLDPGHHLARSPAPQHGARYPRVTPAEVAAAAPEVILLPNEPYPADEADREALMAWPEMPAVRHQRIHLVDGAGLTWAGTHLARALAELPALLWAAGGPEAETPA